MKQPYYRFSVNGETCYARVFDESRFEKGVMLRVQSHTYALHLPFKEEEEELRCVSKNKLQ